MNFYETKMGNIFFNSQIPKLISALQDIASALSKPAAAINPDGTALLKPAPAIRMDSVADPDFLHDLLYWMYETEVFGNREQLSRFDADVHPGGRDPPACPWPVPGAVRAVPGRCVQTE